MGAKSCVGGETFCPDSRRFTGGQSITILNQNGARNIWIRDVFCSPHLWCRGSQPKHVSNPDSVIKKFKPHFLYMLAFPGRSENNNNTMIALRDNHTLQECLEKCAEYSVTDVEGDCKGVQYFFAPDDTGDSGSVVGKCRLLKTVDACYKWGEAQVPSSRCGTDCSLCSVGSSDPNYLGEQTSIILNDEYSYRYTGDEGTTPTTSATSTPTTSATTTPTYLCTRCTKTQYEARG